MLYQNKFEIPFIFFSIDNWEEKKSIILNSLPDYKKYEKGIDLQGPTMKKSPYSDYYNCPYKFPEYTDTVLSCINEELSKFSLITQKDWKLTHLWFLVYEKYANFSVHNHGPEGWSAVLYVNFDEKEHSGTTFYSPYPSWQKDILGTYESYTPKVKEGDLVLFPSNIMHESSMNFSDKNRTIISFNLKEQ